MKQQVIFMFSGQGSHYYQMGREFFDSFPVFQRWMRRLDEMAASLIGISLCDVIYNPARRKGDSFTRTLHTHPAIFMVEFALAQTLIENGIEPDAVLGASLGEFVAAAQSGVLSVEESLAAVIKQAELYETLCPPGGMMAVLHAPEILSENSESFEQSEFAGQNYENHFVVSGSNETLLGIEKRLKNREILFQTLPVSQAFHSSLIDPAAHPYKKFLKQYTYRMPKIPMLSCVDADVLTSVRQEHFWQVARAPIAFHKTIRTLEQRQSSVYIDVGPAGTLANFVKHNFSNRSQSKAVHIMTPYGNGVENFYAVNTAYKSFPRLNKGSSYQQADEERKENAMLAYVFPGQGSQQKGMGGRLFDEFPELTSQADAILGYSIKELCVNDPQKQLMQTQYTQPALFIVSALRYLKKVQETGEKPDFVAGHSLGEYSALFAAGGIDFETGVRLVQKRGALMSQAKDGGMAAVIGMTEAQVLETIAKNRSAAIQIANLNSPTQIVISGPKRDIVSAQPLFEAAGCKMYIPLKVSGAFHSQLMKEAGQEFAEFLKQVSFGELQIPIISNVQARPYSYIRIKQLLAEQMTLPVKWTESVRYLLGKGVVKFEEIGPGDVLTKLIVRIKREAEPLIVDDEPEGTIEKEQPVTVSIPPEKESFTSAVPESNGTVRITAATLGDADFRKVYHLKYAYKTGAMVRGIASKEIVVKMGKAGLMGYFGAGGMGIPELEEVINSIQGELKNDHAYGMNLLCNLTNPEQEEAVVDLYLKYGVTNIEAAAYMQITPALVKYRLKGLCKEANGSISTSNKVMAKISRPEVADAFLRPAPERIVKKLLDDHKISPEEAEMAKTVPMATALCVEADSGGHTDQGNLSVLLPTIIRQRDNMMREYQYTQKIWVGAAGGIGTPEAAATGFMLGADFIMTGSINQCTVEAGTSDAAKEMLAQVNVQDTDYAPAADMFELGAKVQVLKKGVFFPARANKLYDLYRNYNSWDEIDEKTRTQIESKYFHQSFSEVYANTKAFFSQTEPAEIEKAERNPKHKMALVFRWYLWNSMQLAMQGKTDRKVDFQIHCGPAMGAFNQWVQGTPLEDWRNRYVDEIAEKLLQDTAAIFNRRIQELCS